MNQHYDVIVLGGGPAGLTAGIYLGRARVKTLIVDSGSLGGQMIMTYAVANYPGDETEGHSCAFSPVAFRTLGEREGIPADPTVVRAGKAPGIYLARFDLDELRSFRASETQGDAYRKPSTYRPIIDAPVRPPFVRADARR